MAKLRLIYSYYKSDYRHEFYVNEQGKITGIILEVDYSNDCLAPQTTITKEVIALIEGNYLKEIVIVELIKPEIMEEFTKAIKETKSLKMLYLTYHNFLNEIFEAIDRNTSLEEIRFCIDFPKDIEAENITKPLQHNKTVSKITLEGKNIFYQDDIQTLINALEYNTTITKFYIERYELTDQPFGKLDNKYLKRNKKMLKSVVTLIKKHFYNNDEDVNLENFDIKDSYALRAVNLVNKNTLKGRLIEQIDSDDITEKSITNAIKYYKNHYFFYNALQKNSELNAESLFNLLPSELIDKIKDYLMNSNLSEMIKMTKNNEVSQQPQSEPQQNSGDITVEANLSDEVNASGMDAFGEDS